MQFEHFALNVPDPVGMAQWYTQHCGMQSVVSMDQPPFMHFLADRTGRVVVEIYQNPNAATPNYADQNHLVFHHAFAVEDAQGEKARLIAAGATSVEDVTLDDGTELVMLRDPWGIALQLCRRAKPMA